MIRIKESYEKMRKNLSSSSRNMQQIKVIENIEYIDSNEYIVRFSGYINDFQFFEFIPEREMTDINIWNGLYEACLKKECKSIDWEPSNGNSYISVTEDFVEFCMAKYGDGNGGALMVRVPVECCIESFKNVFERLKLKNA